MKTKHFFNKVKVSVRYGFLIFADLPDTGDIQEVIDGYQWQYNFTSPRASARAAATTKLSIRNKA